MFRNALFSCIFPNALYGVASAQKQDNDVFFRFYRFGQNIHHKIMVFLRNKVSYMPEHQFVVPSEFRTHFMAHLFVVGKQSRINTVFYDLDCV